MFTRISSSFLCGARLCSPLSSTFLPHLTLNTSFKGLLRRRAGTFTVPRSQAKHTPACNDSYPRYIPIEDIEPFERYTAGGYCPVRLGDRFQSSRYRVVHKLGHGASSTTWLARDEHLAKYVAIKIAVSACGRPTDSTILRKLRTGEGLAGTTHVNNAMVLEILDEFEVEGPDIDGARGRHHCLVTTLARMSIAEAREASSNRLFQPLVARAIAAQLVQAVAFLHSRGIVHGDLHEGNILLHLPMSIDNLTPDQLYERYRKPELYERYRKPELEQITRLDGQPLDPWVPTHGVVPIWLGDASDAITLNESRIFLSDFGESFQPAVDEPRASHTPLILRAPELFLDPAPRVSYESEIWSLACAIFAIMGQRPLFDTWFPSKDRMLEEHVDTLGPLSEEWWERWANRDQCLDDEFQRGGGSTRRMLVDRIEDSIQSREKEKSWR